MKVTAIETIRLEEFPNLLWVEIHCDQGLTGLGESYFGPGAVGWTGSIQAPDPVRSEQFGGKVRELQAALDLGLEPGLGLTNSL